MDTPLPRISDAHRGKGRGDLIADLGTLGGDFSEALALNDAGQVAGASTSAEGELRVFLWDDGEMIDLGPDAEAGQVRAGHSRRIAMNAGGQVAGTTGETQKFRSAFLWDGEVLIELGTLGGVRSRALAIDGAGRVAGSSETSSGDVHAALWRLLPPPTPEEQVELELVRGIEQALSGPLDAALQSIEEDRPAAIQQLQAFIHQVEAQRGKRLTDEEADALIAAAEAIIAALEAGA